MVFLILVIIVTVYFLAKKKEHFIVFVPIFTLIIDISRIFIAGLDPNLTNFNTILLDYFRGAVFYYISFLILIKEKKLGSRFGVFAMSVLIIFLSFFASDPWTSIKTGLLFTSYLLLLVSAYYYFRKHDSLELLRSKLIYVILLYIINALIFTYLGIGKSNYYMQMLFLGTVSLFAAYGIVYSILILISWFEELRTKHYLVILSAIAIIILTFKRAPVMILGIGVMIFMFYNLHLFRKWRVLLSFMLFLLLSIPVISYTSRFAVQSREAANEMDIVEEGRFKEYVILYDEILQSEDLKIFLFGKDLFNNTQFGTSQRILDTSNRNLHSDYAILLRGTGVIGLILYFSIFIRLLNKFFKLRKASPINKKLNAAFIIIILGLFINGFIDGLTVSTARAIPFLFLGALLGTIELEAKKNLQLQ